MTGPDGRPTVVAGDERIRDWLADIEVDWNDVYCVDHQGSEVVIYRYARDEYGHRFTEGTEVVTLPPLTVPL